MVIGYHMAKAHRDRPGMDRYFMDLAFLASKRSTCTRRAVGAVIVKDGHVLATGYNGPPTGMRHCDVLGCLREDLNIPSGERHELCLGLHAEQNAIIQAAREGKKIDGATIYVTNKPCSVCTKVIVNAGIKDIVFAEDYPDKLSEFILRETGVQARLLEYQQEDSNQ